CMCNMSNYISCSPSSVSCICKPGWTGSSCSDDVNECTNSSLCDSSKKEICHNTPGGYNCSCPSGYFRATSSGICTKIIEKEMQVTFSYNVSSINISDPASHGYQDLKNKTEDYLFKQFQKTVPKLRYVIVLRLSSGSLIVDFNLAYDEDENPNSVVNAVRELATQTQVSLGSHNVTILDVKVNQTT
ncbi:fibulin-1, partial [Biomphalaria pfeifferi]